MSKINLDNIKMPKNFSNTVEQAIIDAKNDKRNFNKINRAFCLYVPLSICVVIVITALIITLPLNNHYMLSDATNTNENVDEIIPDVTVFEIDDENENIFEPITSDGKSDEIFEEKLSDYELPLKEFYISTDWQEYEQSNHYGIDLAAEEGSEIYAVADGIVSIELFNEQNDFWNGGFGLCVIIEHGNGVSTLYSQCSEVLVEKGQEVKKGDLIARVGTTGLSTGPHLHFEYRIDNVVHNPHDILDFSISNN